MRATIALAREKGVAIGAHPGFPDLVGFGRREMRASAAEVHDFVLYQVAALAGMAAAQGATLQQVVAAKVTAPFDAKVQGGLLAAGAQGTSADRFVTEVYEELKRGT